VLKPIKIDASKPHFTSKYANLYTRRTTGGQMDTASRYNNKGAHRMNLVSRLSRTQILFIVLLIVSLLVATLFVIHSAMPGVWHTITLRLVDGPNVPYMHP
jgi:hypothetical protein